MMALFSSPCFPHLFLLNTFTSNEHQKDDNLSRLVIENGTQDWDKIKNLCREVGIYLTREQVSPTFVYEFVSTTMH